MEGAACIEEYIKTLVGLVVAPTDYVTTIGRKIDGVILERLDYFVPSCCRNPIPQKCLFS